MKKEFTLFFYILLLICTAVYAETSDSDSKNDTAAKKFSWNGFIESLNYYGINGKYQNEDNEKFALSKFEAHGKLDAKYDFDSAYIKSVVFGNFYTAASHELRRYYKDKNMLNIQELYFSVLFSNVDFQAGNQVIKWGPANTINPTSYFNPFDLTEILLKDNDELYIGVPAVSSNIMAGDFSLKIVYVPVHTPTRLPERGGPWSLRMPDEKITSPFIPGGIDVPVEMADMKNNGSFNYDRHSINDYSLGARFSAAMHGFDFSISGYHGYDRDIVLFPKLAADPSNPFATKIELTPYYSRITSLGADFALPINDFTFYGEGTYTFNKSAVTNIKDTGEPMARIEKTEFVYYVLGFNWIYDENFKIILEYLQGAYTRCASIMIVEKSYRYVDPFFSNLLSGSIEKKFFDGSLILELRGIYNIKKHDRIFMPRIGWKFESNLLIEVGLTLFGGKPDTLFGSYAGRDVLNFKARYAF